jgi:hypothetical protein
VCNLFEHTLIWRGGVGGVSRVTRHDTDGDGAPPTAGEGFCGVRCEAGGCPKRARCASGRVPPAQPLLRRWLSRDALQPEAAGALASSPSSAERLVLLRVRGLRCGCRRSGTCWRCSRCSFADAREARRAQRAGCERRNFGGGPRLGSVAPSLRRAQQAAAPRAVCRGRLPPGSVAACVSAGRPLGALRARSALGLRARGTRLGAPRGGSRGVAGRRAYGAGIPSGARASGHRRPAPARSGVRPEERAQKRGGVEQDWQRHSTPYRSTAAAQPRPASCERIATRRADTTKRLGVELGLGDDVASYIWTGGHATVDVHGDSNVAPPRRTRTGCAARWRLVMK